MERKEFTIEDIKVEEYFTYSTSSIEHIKMGCEERKVYAPNIDLNKELSDYLLDAPKSLIGIIGIYQEKRNKDQTSEFSLSYFEEAIGEVENKSIANKYGIIDNVHPLLIHVGYKQDLDNNSLAWIPILLNDSLNRVSVSPVNSLPDFSKKKTERLVKLRFKFDKAGQEARDPAANESIIESSIRQARQRIYYQMQMLMPEYRKFGLTRDEWDFFDFFSYRAQHPNPQRN